MTEPRRALPDTTDARNRAVRTFVQGLAFDVIASVVVFVFPLVSDADSFADFDWQVILFLLVKTVLVSVLSYTMRVLKLSPNTE